MNREVNWTRLAQVAVVLLVALGLKQYYSTASANQLRWILAPTTVLVSLTSGESFQFESYAGYITSDRTFVIAAACVGVNFLITAFLMLSLRKLWIDQSAKVSWSFIPNAALVAYLTTLVANAVRITIALQLQRTPPEVGLRPGELHRFEGIFVYFGFLLLLFAISERGRTRSTSGLLSVSVFPLVIYYLTTLGIPLANSAYRQKVVDSDFWQHFVFVLLTPLIFIVPLAAFRSLKTYWLVWRQPGRSKTSRMRLQPEGVRESSRGSEQSADPRIALGRTRTLKGCQIQLCDPCRVEHNLPSHPGVSLSAQPPATILQPYGLP